MRSKSKCRICGKLAYLHSKEYADLSLLWLCDECDKPFDITVTVDDFLKTD